MDVHLHDQFAVQKSMKFFANELSKEFGIRLLTAGNRTPLKEFSGLQAFSKKT